MIFINPKTDYAFKKIFGSSASKNILKSFLNALIYEGESIIEDLEIIEPNLPPRVQGLKDTYLDVRACLNDGTIVIIEMQVLNVQSFGKRVLFNAAKTYAFQLESGEGYRMLKPVIALTITDFEMFPHSDRLISRFIYKEETTNLIYTENDMKLIFVELPKFSQKLEQLETLTDKWIYFMKYARNLTEVPETMDEIPEIHQAFTIANQVNLTPEELDALERREMFIHDQQGAIILGREEGIREGRQEGIREGRQEGIREGRQEGIREKAIAIAQQLLPRLDDETISQITGLSVEELQNLRQNSNS